MSLNHFGVHFYFVIVMVKEDTRSLSQKTIEEMVARGDEEVMFTKPQVRILLRKMSLLYKLSCRY